MAIIEKEVKEGIGILTIRAAVISRKSAGKN
jgi:hypothetical protein